MESIALFSNKKDHHHAAFDLIEQARKCSDFKPDLVLFYATLKYNGNYQSMLDIIGEEYADIPQIGASVDGMIFPEDIRLDGAALVLCKDPEAKISVKGIKEKGSFNSAEKLAQKIKCEKGVVILHFPLVHVPNPIRSVQFCIKGLYYSNRCKTTNPKKQKEYAGRFSDYCDREHIFYLPPDIIEIFAKNTDYKIPIIGMNVLHTQARFKSPNIFCNFKDIEDGIAALIIEKENLDAVYDDIFPDKGRTLEETVNIVRNEFTVVKEFKATFEKNILIMLDGLPPMEAVRNLINVKKEDKDDLMNRMNKGNFQVQMPYMLVFFNKKFNGMMHTGFGSYYPFDLYPFFTDVSNCDEQVFLAYEFINGKFGKFISSLRQTRNQEKFKLFSLDVATSQAFGNKVFDYSDEIKKIAERNYFGIITVAPSIYLPKYLQSRDYITKAGPDIFYTSAGTNVCLEI